MAKILENYNLTKHFTMFELNNERCDLQPSIVHNLTMLALYLESVRSRYGKPIRVTSGFRTTAKNTAVGGVTNSHHLLGKAVDIAPIEKEDFEKLSWSVFLIVPDCLKRYIEVHPKKCYIHIQFGDKDTEKLNFLPYYPF